MLYRKTTGKEKATGLCWCNMCKVSKKAKVEAIWKGAGNLLCEEHYLEVHRIVKENKPLQEGK